MSQKAAKTGFGPTFFVAIEQNFPESARLINDDLAYHILPIGMRVCVWLTRSSWARDWMIRVLEKKAPGVWAMVMCRKLYINDKVVEATVDQTQMVVNLGAGFDTQAYRLPALDKIQVWEVDQSEIINAKRSNLKKVFGDLPTHVNLVSIDLNHQELESVLASQGYDADTKTFFILEGVTQYLTKAGIQTTFNFLAKAPADSRLAFTYVLKDFIDGEVYYDQEYTYEKMLLKNKVWHFGIAPEDVSDFLSTYGWRVLEHHGYEDLTKRYLKPTRRNLKSMALERVVYAEKL